MWFWCWEELLIRSRPKSTPKSTEKYAQMCSKTDFFFMFTSDSLQIRCWPIMHRCFGSFWTPKTSYNHLRSNAYCHKRIARKPMKLKLGPYPCNIRTHQSLYVCYDVFKRSCFQHVLISTENLRQVILSFKIESCPKSLKFKIENVQLFGSYLGLLCHQCA